MPKAKCLFFVTDTRDFTDKLLLTALRKQIKGFTRLGHDTQVFSYNTGFYKAAYRTEVVSIRSIIIGINVRLSFER